MLGAVTIALALLGGPAHARSEGRSVFTLDAEGRVVVQLVFGELDLPELCNADFSLRDRAVEEQKLARCLARDVPLLVRLKADGRPCKLVYEGFTASSGLVHVAARADCGALPRALTLDWGVLGGSPLDHVNTARFEQPWGPPRLALLSKRSPRATLEVARHPAARAAAVMGALGALGAAGAGLMLVVRALRRRRRAPAPRVEPPADGRA